MSEPTARDLETARYLFHAIQGNLNEWGAEMIARALATERARVEQEVAGYSPFMSCCQDATKHVAHRLRDERADSQAKLTRVLTLTPEEAGRLLYESACCGHLDHEIDILAPHYAETATKFLAALAARAAGA